MYLNWHEFFTWFSERFVWFLWLLGFIWVILKKNEKNNLNYKTKTSWMTIDFMCPNKTVEYLPKIWIFWSDILFLVDVSPNHLSSHFFFPPLPEILGIIKKTLGYTTPTVKPCLTATSVIWSPRYYGLWNSIHYSRPIFIVNSLKPIHLISSVVSLTLGGSSFELHWH